MKQEIIILEKVKPRTVTRTEHLIEAVRLLYSFDLINCEYSARILDKFRNVQYIIK